MPERQPPDFRIAIIGAGPKALYALDSLARRLRAAPPSGRLVRIEVLEPAGPPGTGAAYHPEQPSYLRLNVTASIVDVHEPGAPDRVFPGFRDWAEGHDQASAREDFPPRAVIGAYLAAAWAATTTAMPATVQVSVRGERVHRAHPVHRASQSQSQSPSQPCDASVGQVWTLITASGRELGPYDEVLVATGHAADHTGALHRSWSSAIALVPSVYPVHERLSAAAVAPGARVAVRGAALTFIDAALALTEGRGGDFRRRDDGSLAYRPSGREPSAIRPAARSGQLLEPKPEPGTELPPAARAAVAEGRRKIAATADIGALTAILERTAARILATDGDVPRALAAVREALGRALAPGGVRGTGQGVDPGTGPWEPTARQRLHRGIAAAEGTEAGGAVWALGRAWSQLYTAIVARISFAQLPAEDWARFRRLAAVCERWAFGPPLLNARKLEALIEAGIIELCWLDAGVRIEPEGRIIDPIGADPTGAGPGADWPDVVVDAVLAPPGAGPLDPLFRDLIAQGLLTVAPGHRGCATTPEAGAVDPTGRAVAGLSVLGRPTEDAILGHDTLNRTLHDQPRRWAQRLSETLRGER